MYIVLPPDGSDGILTQICVVGVLHPPSIQYANVVESSLSTNLKSSQSGCNLPADIKEAVSYSIRTSSLVRVLLGLATDIDFLYSQLELYQALLSSELLVAKKYAIGIPIAITRADAINTVFFEMDSFSLLITIYDSRKI